MDQVHCQKDLQVLVQEAVQLAVVLLALVALVQLTSVVVSIFLKAQVHLLKSSLLKAVASDHPHNI